MSDNENLILKFVMYKVLLNNHSRTPLIWTLVIRIANNPARLDPSGKHFLTATILHFCGLNIPPFVKQKAGIMLMFYLYVNKHVA